MTSNKFSIQPNVNQSSHQIESDNLKKDFEQNYNSSPLNPPYQIDQSDLKDNIIKEKLNDASLDSSQLCNENNNFKEGLEQNLQKNSNLLVKIKNCLQHDLPLTIYCETCQEPICKNCTLLSPHSTQLHRITSIYEGYQRISETISEFIKTHLFDKKEMLIAQIYRLEYRIEEIQHVKNMIESEARIEYSEILENLKHVEGEKVVILEKEISDLQKDLDSLNDFGNNFMEITTNMTDPVYFILNSRNIYEKIQYLVSKPFKEIINVYPNDLPRELTDKRLELEKSQAFKEIIRFKDSLILKLNVFREEKKAKKKEDFNKAAVEIVNIATKLTNEIGENLKNFYFVCYYCGIVFSQKSVNGKCDQNTKLPLKEFVGYTKKMPFPKYHGNLQHFFSSPNELIHKDVKSLFFGETLEKNQQKALEKEKKNLKTFLEIQVAKIRKNLIEKALNIEELFKLHDKASLGKINYIQFSYILSEELLLESPDIEKIINIINPDSNKSISFDLFLKIINNSNNIEELLKQYYDTLN